MLGVPVQPERRIGRKLKATVLGRCRVNRNVLYRNLNMPRIFLINVGANSAHRATARCPLFSDGSFIFVPFPHVDDTEGMWPYPVNAWPFTNNLRWHQTHVDPDWPRLTYGDYFLNPRAAALKTAESNDILLFWSLLWDNTGDSWFDFTDRQSWHLIGALRIEEALWPGQRSTDARSRNRQRAAYNAHFSGDNSPLEPGNVVFIGDVNHSMLFEFAVPLVTQLDRTSLLYRTFRTASDEPLPLNGKHWSGYTRSCRAICDTTDRDGRKRATILRDAIVKRNNIDILADL